MIRDRGASSPQDRERASFRSVALTLVFLLPLAGLAASGPGPGEGDQSAGAPPLRKIRIALPCAPQSRFAGFYVAIDNGLYRRRGLDVELLSGAPGREPLEQLRAGTADVALLDLTEALAALDAGTPLSHLGQIVNRSNLAIVGWKERGVATLADLDGKRVSLWENAAACRALLADRRLRPVIVPQHDTVNLFLQRGVDACVVRGYREYHMLYQAGVDADQLTRFDLAGAGLDFPEDGLYCLRQTRAALGESASALVAATLEGWREAAQNRDAAVAAVMQRVQAENVLTNRGHMVFMLDQILGSILPGPTAAWQEGVLSRSGYEQASECLVRLGLVRAAPAYEEFVR